ncbi:hypothetical protein L7F22_017774 [Adiantum nelumboides]|nr:hypothetical protein [Adiantum nelumboides]
MGMERVVEYMIKMRQNLSHRLPTIAWEASKKVQKTHKSKILSSGWMKDIKKWLIMEGQLQPAVFGLIIAGASDWVDGYVARRQGIDSVFGTYLDPLADKVLIGCVAISMAQAGYLPLSLVAIVIARDVVLIGGSLALSAHNLKSQEASLQDIFQFTKGSAQKIEPLYISKINTVFQLVLVGMGLLQPAFGFEDSYQLIPLLRPFVGEVPEDMLDEEQPEVEELDDILFASRY